MSNKVELDYREYLDNLFINIRKKNNNGQLSKDYDIFCKQLSDKDNFIGLFVFIGELYKMKLIEKVLIKKYIMILMNNILEANLENTLILETNAQCIKNLLLRCEDKDFYEMVYPNFKKMQEDKKYKYKFKFILMDVSEKYEKEYII